MLKRITAGLASLALAAGFGLAIATPANAQTQMTDTLCAMNEEGQATVTCRISVEESSITEGGEVNVSIRGAQDANVAIALFGPTIDGLVQIGEALPITIADESTAVDVTLPVPVLSGGHEGGRNFWVALADTPSDAEQVFGDRLTVASHRASVASVFGGGSETNPFRLRLDGGIEGDEFKVQAFVNDAWVDFTNVESEPIDENGSGALQVVSPAVERGEYPVRLYNTTQDLPGAEGIYRLLFGVEPEPTPEPTEEPTVEPTEEPTVEPTEEPTVTPTDEPTVTPTDEPTVTPTDEPTVTPTDEPTIAPTPTTSPTQDPGNRPGLPDTGVNA